MSRLDLPSIVKRRFYRGVLVISFSSNKVLEEDLIKEIGAYLVRQIGPSNGLLLIDFTGVQFLNSAMIGQLFLVKVRCRQRAVFAMAGIGPSILETFVISKAIEHIDNYEDLDTAVAKMTRPPERRRRMKKKTVRP